MSIKTPTLAEIATELLAPDWDLVRKWREDSPDISDALAISLENSALAQVMRDMLIESEAAMELADTGTEGAEPVDVFDALPDRIRRMSHDFSDLDAIRREDMPQPGQIVVFDSIESPDPDIEILFHVNRPLVALLSRPTENENVWAGWVVAPESEKYFSSIYDVHLREEDRPYLDSLAGVVQVWNPVRVHIPQASKVIGKLSHDRLSAIHELQFIMLAMNFEYEASSPIGQTHELEMSTSTLTIGTPLSGASDPRVQYQRIYAEVAHALNQPAIVAIEFAGEPTLEAATETVEDKGLLVTLPGLIVAIAEPIMDSFRDFLADLSMTPNTRLAYNVGYRGAIDNEDEQPVTADCFLGDDELVKISFECGDSYLKMIIFNSSDSVIEIWSEDEARVDGRHEILAGEEREILVEPPESNAIVILAGGTEYRFPVSIHEE